MRKPENIAPLSETLSEWAFAALGYVFPAVIGALWLALPFHIYGLTEGMDTALLSVVGAVFTVGVVHRFLWK